MYKTKTFFKRHNHASFMASSFDSFSKTTGAESLFFFVVLFSANIPQPLGYLVPLRAFHQKGILRPFERFSRTGGPMSTNIVRALTNIYRPCGSVCASDNFVLLLMNFFWPLRQTQGEQTGKANEQTKKQAIKKGSRETATANKQKQQKQKQTKTKTNTSTRKRTKTNTKTTRRACNRPRISGKQSRRFDNPLIFMSKNI